MHGLKLRRPLAFLDLESTGTSPRSDRIIEVAILKMLPDGESILRCRRVNPGVPIPPEASRVHGITDEMVAHEPPFHRYARGLRDFLADCDLAGFNINGFDLPLLLAEFRRAGVDFSLKGRAIIDVMEIFHTREPRHLAAAVEFYCGQTHPKPHAAQEDVLAAVQVLQGQLRRYPDLADQLQERLANPSGADWVDAEGRFVWQDGVVVVNFGRHRGKTLDRLAAEEPDYLRWILAGDFSAEVKQLARDALAGTFPSPPVAEALA